MYISISQPNMDLGISSFPIEIYLRNKFKDFIDILFQKTDLVKSSKPKLYKPLVFIFAKLFATISKSSIDKAAEYLNKKTKRLLVQKGLLKEKVYRDKHRKWRIIPHQTDIDKFFRRMTENDVRKLLRSAND